MRRRPNNQIELLRNPGELIPKLASHIDVAALSPSQRWRLMRRAPFFANVIAKPTGLDFKRGLSELLDISREEARKVALTFTGLDRYTRTALQVRLTHLGIHAPADQVRSFLKLVPRISERISSAFRSYVPGFRAREHTW